MPWMYRLNLPGSTGGFLGRCAAPERDEAVARALDSMGEGRRLIQAEQVHGGDIAVVTEEMVERDATTLPGVDALVTNLPHAALAIYVADCLAIYLADVRGRAVGLAHGGWRGLAASIPVALVDALAEVAGGSAAEMRAALSPCIRGCCFEVGEEVATRFDHIRGAVDRSGPEPHVDMIAVAAEQLRAAGVPGGSIEVMDGCTRCDPESFASYRWDPERCGRNVALIGRKSG